MVLGSDNYNFFPPLIDVWQDVQKLCRVGDNSLCGTLYITDPWSHPIPNKCTKANSLPCPRVPKPPVGGDNNPVGQHGFGGFLLDWAIAVRAPKPNHYTPARCWKFSLRIRAYKREGSGLCYTQRFAFLSILLFDERKLILILDST